MFTRWIVTNTMRTVKYLSEWKLQKLVTPYCVFCIIIAYDLANLKHAKKSDGGE